jgi:hypothetical protein
MSWLRSLAQFVALPLLAAAIAILWVYCNGFLGAELHQMGLPVALAAPAAVIASALLFLVAPALPLAALFRQRAAFAAVAVGWPPLALTFALRGSGSSIGSSAFGGFLEAAVCWAAVILGAWLASRRWPPIELPAHSLHEGENAL